MQTCECNIINITDSDNIVFLPIMSSQNQAFLYTRSEVLSQFNAFELGTDLQ